MEETAATIIRLLHHRREGASETEQQETTMASRPLILASGSPYRRSPTVPRIHRLAIIRNGLGDRG